MLSTVRSNPGGANTSRYYGHILRPFVERIDPATATALDIERIVRAPRKDGKPRAPATVRQILIVIRHFLARACEWKLRPDNPAAGIKLPRIVEGPVRAIAALDVAVLLNAIPRLCSGRRNGHARAMRDVAFATAAIYTGLRRSELAGLKAGDLTGAWLAESGLAYASVRVKGGRTRQIVFPSQAVTAIRTMLAARGERLDRMQRDASLWGGVTGDSLARAMRAHAEAAGLGRVTPHCFRHGYTLVLLEAGRTVLDLQELLGHAHPSITDRYARRVRPAVAADNGPAIEAALKGKGGEP